MVKWSEPAILDLRSIHDFIAHDSRFYARKVIQDIRDKADILNELPKIGKKVPELDVENIRELSLYSYRIIYEIRSQGIFMLAVIHKRRDLKPEDIETIKFPQQTTLRNLYKEHSMKAIVLEEIGGPDNLKIKEVDTPEPGPGEVRVRLQQLRAEPARLLDHYRAAIRARTCPVSPGRTAPVRWMPSARALTAV